MSIFKSSNSQFWPILAKIFTDKDLYSPFVVGILLGDGKPHDSYQVLMEFVNDINNLQINGLQVDNEKFEISIMCFVCDTPARAFLKQTKGHGGYGACERCSDRGERCDNRMIYPTVDKEKRTDDSFRSHTDPDHHIAITPLLKIEPKVDMVKDFILDYMHLACNGIMLKLLEQWITGKRKVRLGRKEIKELNRRIKCLKKCMPLEFQRKLRPIKKI